MKSSAPCKDTPNIETLDSTIKIGNVMLDEEALKLLDDIQDSLGGHYRTSLRRISDLLIDNFEDMSIEHEEAMRLLQMLSNLRQDLHTLMWPRNPIAAMSGFDMMLEQSGETSPAGSPA